MQLDVVGLHKYFGDNHVLRDVSFSAEPGAALGLLGRNGAGKTTTIRIMMDVFPPDEGRVLYNGTALRYAGVRIGYLPEERGLYPKIPIGRQLNYLARLRGLSPKDADRSVRKWTDRLEMTQHLDQKLDTLSRGNQQKIQLALTLLGDPDIVMLDEPFSGLDPVNAQLLREIVSEQVRDGRIVLFSSHQMGMVEQFCDRVAILHQGQIVLHGGLREIKRSYPRHWIRVRIDGPEDGTARRLNAHMKEDAFLTVADGFQPDPDGSCRVHLRQPEHRDRLLDALRDAGDSLETFSVVEPSLEQIFVEKAGDDA